MWGPRCFLLAPLGGVWKATRRGCPRRRGGPGLLALGCRCPWGRCQPQSWLTPLNSSILMVSDLGGFLLFSYQLSHSFQHVFRFHPVFQGFYTGKISLDFHIALVPIHPPVSLPLPAIPLWLGILALGRPPQIWCTEGTGAAAGRPGRSKPLLSLQVAQRPLQALLPPAWASLVQTPHFVSQQDTRLDVHVFACPSPAQVLLQLPSPHT